jgi:hypothetical protein
MQDLEYRIGALKIDPNHLKYDGIDHYDADHWFDPYEAHHKFVVEAKDATVSIYIIEAHSHHWIVLQQKLDEDALVGGGSIYLDTVGRLVISDYSDDYRSIPKSAAQKFAQLLLPELEKQGIELNGVVVDTSERRIHGFWKNK